MVSDRLPWEPAEQPPPVEKAQLTTPYAAGRGRGYAQTALDQEVQRVTGASNGTRNHSLNRAAFSLGQLVAGGELDEVTVMRELTAAAALVGLVEREIGPTIRSGLVAGAQHPRATPPREGSPNSPPTSEDAEAWGTALRAEMHQQRLRREARRLLEAEERPPAVIPELLTLDQRLARPHPSVAWRVDGWQPAGSRVMLAAQFKAGKTTLVGNLVRSLADGAPFLGQHRVEQLSGTVAILDFEMSPRQLDGWLADQQITSPDRVVVVPLRGAAGAFDILDPTVRAKWAALLRERQVEYLVVDCLRPVLDTLGLDEHREAGRFLVALDALLAEAGIPDALVVHHMGHQAERSRGDSRIRDWPDVEWRLVRQDEDPASPRYLSGYGRDVDQPETALGFNPAARHLRLMAGSRKEAGARAALHDILSLLTGSPGLSANSIEMTLLRDTDHRRKDIRSAIKLGVTEGSVEQREGPRRAHLHYSLRQFADFAVSSPGEVEVSTSPPLYRGEVLANHSADPPSQLAVASTEQATVGYCRSCGMSDHPTGSRRHTSSCPYRHQEPP